MTSLSQKGPSEQQQQASECPFYPIAHFRVEMRTRACSMCKKCTCYVQLYSELSVSAADCTQTTTIPRGPHLRGLCFWFIPSRICLTCAGEWCIIELRIATIPFVPPLLSRSQGTPSELRLRGGFPLEKGAFPGLRKFQTLDAHWTHSLSESRL